LDIRVKYLLDRARKDESAHSFDGYMRYIKMVNGLYPPVKDSAQVFEAVRKATVGRDEPA